MPILTASTWQDYALLDSGHGRKLERFGPVTLVRPEAQATWSPALPRADWDAAHAAFEAMGQEGGRWQYRRPLPSRWEMGYAGLRFWVQASESRQVGVFPENAVHWDWIAEQVQAAGYPLRVLNLFGYTGLATLAAAGAGAHVTHVDASKKAVLWARENQALSSLQDRPIRWIVEDALTYLRREARRGVRYDGIVLDPPAFGRGPGGEVWTFDRLFDELCRACRAVLSASPQFIVATVYTRGVTEQALRAAMDGILAGPGGQVEVGQLATVERSAGRVLHNALYARWS
ncbi:MAG TPA: class I SAM-dependent methyltransferase [Anaerolineae bacterium]|nr:class I SAM-dependent methyltransferase [Anaerolineae bacterium]